MTLIIIGDNNIININDKQISDLKTTEKKNINSELLPSETTEYLKQLPGYIDEENMSCTFRRIKEIFSINKELNGCYILWTNDSYSIGLTLS